MLAGPANILATRHWDASECRTDQVLPGRILRRRQPAAGHHRTPAQSDPNRPNSINTGHRACQGAARRWARGMRSTQPCDAAARTWSRSMPPAAWRCSRRLSGAAGRSPGCTRCSAMPRRWPPVFSRRDAGEGAATPGGGAGGDGGTVDIGLGLLSECSNATTTCCSSATTTRRT